MGVRDRLGALGLTLPAVPQMPAGVVTTFSWVRVVLNVFGPTVGEHARTAIGVAALPLNLPVVVAAELHLAATHQR